MSSPLFAPMALRDLKLPNRIVVSPMCQYSAQEGSATDWHLLHLGSLAVAGPGLLMIEATAVEADGRITLGCLGLYSDANEAALRRVVDACRRFGNAPLGIQLAHAGRKGSATKPWQGIRTLTEAEGGWQTLAPSSLPLDQGWPAPQAVSTDDLDRLTEAFGAATKTVPYVMDGTKLYRFTLRFGEARDTDDADGKVTATSEVRPSDQQIEAALPRFRGEIMQVPPAFSAVKVAGERAYDMAREGRAPTLEPRPARVDSFDLVERPDPDTAIFDVASGKGVYMRSLARDLAAACGSLGHITALRRMRVGPFTEAQAIPLDKLRASDDIPPASPDLLLPVATALADIPALALTEAEAGDLRQGRAISLVALMGRIPGSADPDVGLARAMAGGRVIGLARLKDGWLKPERML
jgi:tRNA pseudouridine55 synthase